jgi:SAM-dependent methyltransferase
MSLVRNTTVVRTILSRSQCRTPRPHQRRYIVSFLLQNFYHFFSAESSITSRESPVQHEETEEDTNYRYSMVHGHPLGPWQAILNAVQVHHAKWKIVNNKSEQVYHVLDVACGPRGEPGTTIALALPHASVHCIDSCSIAIDSVRVHAARVGNDRSCIIVPNSVDTLPIHSLFSASSEFTNVVNNSSSPPFNLIKSVCNMDRLNQHFRPNSMNVIVCCYGYGLSSDVLHALQQAYTILRPGGVLILSTWQYSSIAALSQDILATVHAGTGDSAETLFLQRQYDMDIGIPPPAGSVSQYLQSKCNVEYSGPNEWEILLHHAGFSTLNIVSSCHSYPICMGTTRNEQFNLGTLSIQSELHYSNAYSNNKDTAIYKNSAEEAFWMNISSHSLCTTSMLQAEANDALISESGILGKNHVYSNTTVACASPALDIATTTMWMPNNTFKLTVSTKDACTNATKK